MWTFVLCLCSFLAGCFAGGWLLYALMYGVSLDSHAETYEALKKPE